MTTVPIRLRLASALSRDLRVRRTGPAAWTVSDPHAHDQRVTRLVRIDNPGPATRITVRLRCANPAWISHLYLVQGQRITAITGTAGVGCVTFSLDAPAGVSHIGPEVWYSNEDADRFLRRMQRRSNRCRVDDIGHTAAGRPIRRLVIGDMAAKHVVVVAAREHADEPSGSFAVEAVAEHLLTHLDDDPCCRRCRFDLLPIVNPDGVARGEAYPQPGPSTVANPNRSDPHYCGMTSDDPTVTAWREYLFAQRPAALANYHAYWSLSFPQVIFYDKRDGLALVDHLIHDDLTTDCRWYVMRQAAEQRTMLRPCVERFGTVVALFELPWRGRSVPEVRALGVRMFEATLAALRQRLALQ